MNIFYLHKIPIVCASYHCDKHAVKMLLEYTQLLCTAHRLLEPDLDHRRLYKATHVHHPCAVWVRKSSQHYDWLYSLLLALHDEYTSRYNRLHASYDLLEYIYQAPYSLEDRGFIDPPQCMPDIYKTLDTTEAYKNFYLGDKSRFAKWKLGAPNWFTKGMAIKLEELVNEVVS